MFQVKTSLLFFCFFFLVWATTSYNVIGNTAVVADLEQQSRYQPRVEKLFF